MGLSQLLQLTGSAGSSGLQGIGGGHHRHHKSIADQITDMGTAIDKAVSNGKLSSDQATAMKKELADITQTLQKGQTPNTGASDQTGRTNPLSQLSDSDRKKIFSELQDVRKQLHSALNPQSANATSVISGSNDAVSALFSNIDADKNGAISKDEFTQFLAQVGATALGYNQQGNTSSLNGSTFSVTG